jgi:two-component system NtrC family sensor kinase
MRLAWKLIVALLLGLIAVLALSGWLRVREEIKVFENDMRRDHEVVSHMLEPSLQVAWRAGGEPAVAREVGRRATVGRLSLRWLPPTAVASADDPDRRSNTFPLRVDGREVGAVQISEPRDQERAFIRGTRLRTGLTTLALAGMAAAVVMGLTFVLIGRPVRLLRAKTRRIASGDLTGALGLPQQDEIGDLARDIDQMCTDLASARQRAEDESRARVQALEQLRHADRLASVGTFASGIAHEMGTPLGVVLARARLIEEDGGLPKGTTGSAKIIAEQVERMSRIIRQLLEFARSGPKPSADGLEPAPQPVDVRALTRASAALLQPLAQKKQVKLVIDEGGPLLVRGQPGLLQQVLLNLLMNAMQAMDRSGEVNISSATTDAAPPAGVEAQPGRYVRLRVDDQGPGIPPESLPRVFEPFFTTKPVGEGTGLGLSVTWGIVREFGGWIEVSRAPGAGARFDVFLPRQPEQPDKDG